MGGRYLRAWALLAPLPPSSLLVWCPSGTGSGGGSSLSLAGRGSELLWVLCEGPYTMLLPIYLPALPGYKLDSVPYQVCMTRRRHRDSKVSHPCTQYVKIPAHAHLHTHFNFWRFPSPQTMDQTPMGKGGVLFSAVLRTSGCLYGRLRS